MNAIFKIVRVVLILLFCCSSLHCAYAHDMIPDLTVITFKVHYDGKAMTCTLQGPMAEVTGLTNLSESNFVGDDTTDATLKAIERVLPKLFLIEQNGKPLQGEVEEADKVYYKNGAEHITTVRYETSETPQKLRITSKFVHTLLSSGGVQREIRVEKEETINFNTNATVGDLFRNLTDFVIMGMMHLFTGIDHILFICTLIFSVTNFKTVVKMLTGFTIGHATTLILSTLNVIHIPARFADIGVALTIAYVGFENIWLGERTPKWRPYLVTVFGLIHGLGFAENLREFGLPQEGLFPCLLAFNLGLEIAQVCIVTVVFPILLYWGRRQKFLYEEQGEKNFRRLLNLGSLATACLGLYWFYQRITGA